MVRSRLTAYRSGDRIRVVTISALIALFASFMVHGQSRAPEIATLQGSVRDSGGHPLAGATVSLWGKGRTQALTAYSDSDGIYRFLQLRKDVYILRAEKARYREATLGPFVLGQEEAKRIDLTLESRKTSESQSPSAETLEFFDEPQFTVAGVIDSTNLGGHGSDKVLRTTEALAKETASLNNGSHSLTVRSIAETEKSLRETAEHEPGNFDANQRLGRLLVSQAKPQEALPYLERASQLKPADYDTGFELAVAYTDVGNYEHARMNVRTLLAQHEKAELHHLLGDIEEKMGNPLEAVREYQQATELNTSEPNLFDWGTELLIHRAVEPAIEVFTKGNRLFPGSVRMLVGLGVAWYGAGSYDQAVKRVCQASDLNPVDPNPYLFLGKMQDVETTQSQALASRLRRFVQLQPENALANYYYAISLRKKRNGPYATEELAQVESLLEKAVHLDPKLGLAYLQLGVLYSDRKDFSSAISAYQQAIKASPQLEEPHYRLAQAYSRIGERSKAHEELQIYDQISKKSADAVERERREIQQFVYTLRSRTSGPQQR